MLEQARERTGRFRWRLAEEGGDVAILTDETSIAWLPYLRDRAAFTGSREDRG